MVDLFELLTYPSDVVEFRVTPCGLRGRNDITLSVRKTGAVLPPSPTNSQYSEYWDFSAPSARPRRSFKLDSSPPLSLRSFSSASSSLRGSPTTPTADYSPANGPRGRRSRSPSRPHARPPSSTTSKTRANLRPVSAKPRLYKASKRLPEPQQAGGVPSDKLRLLKRKHFKEYLDRVEKEVSQVKAAWQIVMEANLKKIEAASKKKTKGGKKQKPSKPRVSTQGSFTQTSTLGAELPVTADLGGPESTPILFH